ncbi:Pentatricopeptide repeat-containing protein [Chlorella vulgaris]
MYTFALLVGSFVLWIASEKTLLHFSRTARRLFWYLLACAIGVVLVRWLQSIEGLGMMWVFLSAIMAASMIEDEVVKSKGLTLMEIEATQRLRLRLRTPEAQGKAERLMDIVGTISQGRGATLGARQLWARMSGTMRRLRRSLHDLLQQAEADELNYILCTINAPAMVEVCSRATMELLTRERLPELTTETRSVVVDALQKIGMRYRPQRQLWAAAVLLNTRGLELTLLKNYLDDGGDYHTCYKLWCAAAAGHGAQGKAVMVEFARLAPNGPPGVVLKLLSDVDDTVFSSGGSFPAGSDTRYPKKCYYPGALSLYTELDRCFARRHQPALHRLRMAQRQHPMVLPGAALAAPVPASAEGVGVEEDVAGGSPRAEGGAERTPPAEPISEHQFAGGAGRAESDNWLGQEVEATTAVAQAAPEGRQLSVSGDRPSHPIPVPQQQHGSSSLRRPPRSPRPGLAPPAAASRRPLAMSPQSSRQLPVGEPLMSPLGTSPPSSSGMLGLEDGAGSSLAGSTWGGSSLGTTQPRGALGSGSTELADTLTSRLRPLVTSGASQPAQPFAQQQRSDYEWMSPQPLSPVAAPHQEGSNLVFLSARPESYKGMTESEAYRKYFQPFVQRGDLDTSPTMLLGAMASGPKALLQWLGVVTWFPALAPPEDSKTAVAALYQQLAAKKLSRFREYAAIFPEACFVMIGDNGQGDLLCSEILWSSMRQNLPPGQRSRLLKTVKAEWQASWLERSIFFAKSHVGMALQAHDDNLLTTEALHRVCLAAAADFRRIWARYGGRHAGRNLGKALKHLNADLRAANQLLPPRMQVPPLAIAGLTEGELLKGSRLPPPSPARSEALSDFSAFGPSPLWPMALTTSAVLQALHITLSAKHASSRRAAASSISAALRPSTAPVPHHSSIQRRQSPYTVVEASQAGGAPHGSGAAVNVGRGSGGNPWETVVAALDKRQPEVAWRQFMQLLEQGLAPPSNVCDLLIYALCGRQRFQEAWRVYSATSPAGHLLAYNTYQSLISLAIKVGNLEAAVDVYRDMQAAGRPPNVVTSCGLIAALGRERRRRGVRYAHIAHELWTELCASGVQLDGAAYRTGIKACVDVGRLREADKLLLRMAAKGVPPDVRAYNILLSGHSRAAATGAMGRLLQRMAAAGVEPSAVTYNTLVDGYVRARDLLGAQGVAERAAAAGVALDVWTYSTLIKGHVQASQLATAEAVLKDMAAAGVQPSCVTFTTVLDGHVRAGDMEAARRILHMMLAAGEAPNALTYNSLLRGYAANASAAAASGARSSIVASSNGKASVSSVKAAAATASAAGQASALAAAMEVLRDMQGRGVAPSVDTFNTLMAAAVTAGECPLALDVYARLRRAGLRADGLTHTILIQAHGRMGQVAEAAAAFEALLRDRSAAPDLRAYNALVDALARNGDMAAAERMLSAATEMASKQGLPPPVEAFGAVVAGYSRQVAVAPAVAAVKRFHAAGGSPDAQMLDVLANIAIRAGDYKVAMQAVRALELIGREVDKAKYAALLEDARARQTDSQSMDRPQHNRTWAAYQRRRDARRKNVQLERFKWLLGLPNSYYSDSESESLDEFMTRDEWELEQQQQRQERFQHPD